MNPSKPPVPVEELQAVFAAGGNVMEHMRRARAADRNDEAAILYSYDLQAGSYVASLAEPAVARLKNAVGQKLGQLFADLGGSVVMEAGVGEATTLAEVLSHASFTGSVLGFDISLSRLLHARAHLVSRGHSQVELFTAALETIPLARDAVDILYTFHSIEPNGGRERSILEELLRVTRHHLVLVEPSNELGSQQTRERIDEHRYVKDLKATLDAMGCKITRFEPWGLDANPRNEAALIVVEKSPVVARASDDLPVLASPLSRRPLVRRPECLYSREDGLAFPVIAGVPCLLPGNGVVATQLEHFGR